MKKTLTEKTYVWAHRGACGYAPENTMPAFKLALDMDADGIELDVHFSKDGKIVVCHDEKIDRTSNGQGKITDYTYEELLAFDFGVKFAPEFKGTKIPLLSEVYELFAPTGKVVNVEIKSIDPAIPAALVALEKECGMEGRVIYSSFDHEQIARTLVADPNAFIAPLYSFNMVKAWDYVANIPAKASHPKMNQVDLYPEYVEEMHKRGIRVHAWTVNTAEDVKHLAEAGVDAVITNYPDVAKKALD